MCNHSVIVAAAALLLTGAVASAQLAVPPGQDGTAVPGSGYGAPYSPRNAPRSDEPQSDETTGQALKFEDRWIRGTPSGPPAAMPDVPPAAGQPSDKKINPEESKTGMDE